MPIKTISVFCILLCAQITTYADDDRLIVTEEWAPFNYTDDNKLTGISYDVVTHLMQKLNKSYDIEILPSMRTISMISTRPNTMMFSMFRTPAREPQFHWIGPIADGSVYFYKIKGTEFSINSLSELKQSNLHICSRGGGIVHRLLLELGISNLEDFATNGTEVYKMLLAGRCDLAISETDFGTSFILKNLGYSLEETFEKLPFPFYQADLYLVGSKDIPKEEIQQWQSALDNMKSSGTYADIIQKYQ